MNKKPKSLKVHQLSCASIKDKIYILNQIWEILFTEVNNNDYNSFLVTLCLVECQQNILLEEKTQEQILQISTLM